MQALALASEREHRMRWFIVLAKLIQLQRTHSSVELRSLVLDQAARQVVRQLIQEDAVAEAVKLVAELEAFVHVDGQAFSAAPEARLILDDLKAGLPA